MPLIPISFGWGYQCDMFIGNKMSRIRNAAEELLENDPELFRLPNNNLFCSDEEYDEILNIKERIKK